MRTFCSLNSLWNRSISTCANSCATSLSAIHDFCIKNTMLVRYKLIFPNLISIRDCLHIPAAVGVCQPARCSSAPRFGASACTAALLSERRLIQLAPLREGFPVRWLFPRPASVAHFSKPARAPPSNKQSEMITTHIYNDDLKWRTNSHFLPLFLLNLLANLIVLIEQPRRGHQLRTLVGYFNLNLLHSILRFAQQISLLGVFQAIALDLGK